MPEETVINRRTVYDGRAFRVRVDTIKKPDGKTTTRDIVEHSNCVCVVVLDEDGQVVLVRQYRHAVGRALLEIPAGGIDPGESPADCVRRELQEEIGYIPANIEDLGGFYAAPGYSSEYLHLFLATGLTRSRLTAEDTDEIEVVRKPLGQVPDLIASGEIQDAKSIAGLLRFICLGRKE